VPTANQVETITDRDAPRDLVEAHYDGFRDTTPESTLVPDRALGDVIQTTLTHGATRVGMQVDYAELQPVRSVDGGDWLSVEMVTDEGARWRLSGTQLPITRPVSRSSTAARINSCDAR